MKASRFATADHDRAYEELISGAAFNPATSDAGYRTENEVAERYRNSPATLQRWRSVGIGPRYLKVGVRVLYRLDDLLAYEDECLRQTTSQVPFDRG